MHLAFSSLFLTLVVLTAKAAPDSSMQPPLFQTKETFQKTDSGVDKDSLQTTVAPAYDPRLIRRGDIYSNGSTNFGIGYAVGKFDKEKDTKDLTTFHLQRTQYNLDETAQEFGLNLTSNNLIGIDWGYKKLCCFSSFVSDWKPYYKIGAAALFDPKDQLANVIDYQRYFWQAAVGLENLFSMHKTFRLEAGARIGYPGSHFYAHLLYAIPD